MRAAKASSPPTDGPGRGRLLDEDEARIGPASRTSTWPSGSCEVSSCAACVTASSSRSRHGRLERRADPLHGLALLGVADRGHGGEVVLDGVDVHRAICMAAL